MNGFAKRFIVLLTLPEQINSELQPLREKYDPKNSNKIIPHITLQRPFTVKASLNEIKPKLEKVAKNNEQFSLGLTGIGKFTGQNRVVYVEVKNNTALIKLQSEIFRSLIHLTENLGSINYQFTPHVTIASDLTLEKFQKIKKDLVSFHPQYEFVVQSFWLFEFDENKIWQPIEEFKSANKKDD